MRRGLAFAAVVAALVAGASHAHGQKFTERYIPIGQSPGLSGKVTAIGVIGAANAGAQTIAVARDGEQRLIRVTDRTRIWLDRSRAKLTALDGTFADLVPGRRVEVMPEGSTPGAPAAWIKVETDAPGR